MHHEYSHELLIHLRCGACRGYWSLSDTETTDHRILRGLFCPWCGVRAHLWPMEPEPKRAPEPER